jgi:hypothetical protein
LAGHGLKTERRLPWTRIAGREAFLTQAANKAYRREKPCNAPRSVSNRELF